MWWWRGGCYLILWGGIGGSSRGGRGGVIYVCLFCVRGVFYFV